MPNIVIVDDCAACTGKLLEDVRGMIERMGLADETITTTLLSEPEINGEAIVLYGYLADGLEEGEAYARIITERTGIKTIVFSSDCMTVGKIDGSRQWAGFLAVHATAERMEEIIEKLKGKMNPGFGILSITTFDVEKHQMEARKEELVEQPYVRIIATDQDHIAKITDGLIRFGFPPEKIFSKNIAGFITASDME